MKNMRAREVRSYIKITVTTMNQRYSNQRYSNHEARIIVDAHTFARNIRAL